MYFQPPFCARCLYNCIAPPNVTPGLVLQAPSRVPKNQPVMEVVCIIGERVYHAPGSECHRKLEGEKNVLTLTDGQAHEVGMEPCGYCLRPKDGAVEATRY